MLAANSTIFQFKLGHFHKSETDEAAWVKIAGLMSEKQGGRKWGLVLACRAPANSLGGKAAELKERLAPAALPSLNLPASPAKRDEEPFGFTTREWRWTRAVNNSRGNHPSWNRKSERLPARSGPIYSRGFASYEHQFSAARADAILAFRVEQGGFGFLFE